MYSFNVQVQSFTIRLNVSFTYIKYNDNGICDALLIQTYVSVHIPNQGRLLNLVYSPDRMSPYIIEFQSEDHEDDPFVVSFDKDPSACTWEEVLQALKMQIEAFVNKFNCSHQRIHLRTIAILKNSIRVDLGTIAFLIQKMQKIDHLKWGSIVDHEQSMMKIMVAQSSTLQDVQSPADGCPPREERMSLKEAEERMKDVVRVYSARKILAGQEPGILSKRVAGGLSDVENAIMRECERKINRERKYLVANSEATEDRLEKVAENERRKLLRSGVSAESSVKWKSSIGNHLMAVYELGSMHGGTRRDIAEYLENKAELYPVNWFLPHTTGTMVGGHDLAHEKLTNTIGKNGGNGSNMQGENSPANSHCYNASLQEEDGSLQQSSDLHSELVQTEARIEALESEVIELKKKLATMKKGLNKHGDPKRRRKGCSKENAHANFHSDQMFVL